MYLILPCYEVNILKNINLLGIWSMFCSYKKIHKYWFKLQAMLYLGWYEHLIPLPFWYRTHTLKCMKTHLIRVLKITHGLTELQFIYTRRYDIRYVKYSIILINNHWGRGVGDRTHTLTLDGGRWLASWLRERSASTRRITSYVGTTVILYAVA